MKFLPYQFRETQSDFFGKKGISWHISCLVTKSENEEFDLQCYVHILENGSQGWFSVANIILHLLTNIKSTRPTLKEVFLKSDNAACYHCTNLLAFIQQNNGQFPIKVAEYNFSEAQSGKDLCDSKTGSCRMHIYKYANEGHDVLNPRSMKLALDSYGGVKGTQSCIVTVNADDEPKTKIRMPGISTYNNFNFENDGIIARKAYKVGEGHVIKTSTQYSETISVERVYKLEVLEPFAQDQPICGKLNKFADSRIEDTHDQQPSLEEDQPMSENSMNSSTSSAYFSCPDFSCDKVFASSNNLDRHLLLGNHNYRKNTISSMDTAVQIYSSSCIDLQKYHENVIQEASHEVEISVNLTEKSRRGWGLKSKRANVRFSDKVKTYLQEICASCEKTGSRPDFIALSEELRKATDENGNKLFTKQEWLNPPQIKGFIANIISKSKSSLAVKKPRTELQEVNVDDDEKLSEVISMLEMNDYNENAVGIVNEVFSAINI
ncbi:unnamed protein product [Mytilus edulis]|uniref:C2H2-type domain-containing protein n=1 Tax=Mytilus edulis TaxID=6550 RepID=A0A8S3ULJ4_MYTED|nr:unnamed protein product [Mytilus edulis]